VSREGLGGIVPPGPTQFGAVLHDMLADADVPETARRWASGDLDPGLRLWRRLADLGVTALAVPEKQGGLGASPLDLVVACEELGHHAVPGPVAESLAAVPVLLGEAGSCGEWLAGLAAGDLIATLAAPPCVPLAVDAEAAGLVLHAEDGVLRRGSAGATLRSVDPSRSLASVAPLTLLAPLAQDVAGAVARALDFGALACSAQLLGAGRALLEASVRHAGLRVQFGRQIGSFQAVKHRLADVAIGLEFARPLLEAAAVALAEDGQTARRDVSAAKVACAEAAYQAARAALQVHGAIGYTAEHELSRFLLQVRALAPAWGTSAEHRARVLRELGP